MFSCNPGDTLICELGGCSSKSHGCRRIRVQFAVDQLQRIMISWTASLSDSTDDSVPIPVQANLNPLLSFKPESGARKRTNVPPEGGRLYCRQN